MCIISWNRSPAPGAALLRSRYRSRSNPKWQKKAGPRQSGLLVRRRVTDMAHRKRNPKIGKKKPRLWGSGVPGSGRVPDMHKIGARLDRRGRKPPKPDTQLIKYKKKK